MLVRTQFITGLPGKIGIAQKHLDGELYLVGDALTRRLVTRPKFEIGNFVVQAIAIFVMHAFVLCQRALQMFRHYISVLKNSVAATQVQAHVAGGKQVSVRIDGAPCATFPTTFLAAEFLADVVGAVRTSVFVPHHAAFFRYATQLALECRRWFFAHRDWLPVPMGSVKENF